MTKRGRVELARVSPGNSQNRTIERAESRFANRTVEWGTGDARLTRRRTRSRGRCSKCSKRDLPSQSRQCECNVSAVSVSASANRASFGHLPEQSRREIACSPLSRARILFSSPIRLAFLFTRLDIAAFSFPLLIEMFERNSVLRTGDLQLNPGSWNFGCRLGRCRFAKIPFTSEYTARSLIAVILLVRWRERSARCS